MNFNKTLFDGLFVIEPKLYFDNRGLFFESYNKNIFDKRFKFNFVQDNESVSVKGVIRGLHFQKPPYDQTKLVRCLSGRILDVVVDLRKNSKSYGKSFQIELSSENYKQLLIPKGFAHGFQVLSNQAIVNYKVDNYYNPTSESGLIWNDLDLAINWNKKLKPIISEKDLLLDSFLNFKSPFQ
jgi:dTDP-4-dehydrorhamnose 3,5-epimerase